jgi:hypothetical protein
MIDGKTFVLAIGVVVATASSAQAQSVRTREITSGACMVVCDDVSFCRSMDYDKDSGICTVHLNRDDPGFKALRHQCPQVAPENWVISYANERWSIGCPGK